MFLQLRAGKLSNRTLEETASRTSLGPAAQWIPGFFLPLFFGGRVPLKTEPTNKGCLFSPWESTGHLSQTFAGGMSPRRAVASLIEASAGAGGDEGKVPRAGAAAEGAPLEPRRSPSPSARPSARESQQGL